MNDAFGRPQNVVLLGGRSDIGTAILREVGATTRRAVLAVRDPEDTDTEVDLPAGAETTAVHFDGRDPSSVVDAVDAAAAVLPDIDLAVLSYGMLGDQERAGADPDHACEIATVNYLSAVAGLTRLAELLRRQGHGTIVVLSSVAGERVRPSNHHYGASKAALDGFCQGLAGNLRGSGARVLIVRPGFVDTKMTAGMTPAPFSTTPRQVALAVHRALAGRRRVVWVPAPLRWVMAVIRHLPAAAVDRLPR